MMQLRSGDSRGSGDHGWLLASPDAAQGSRLNPRDARLYATRREPGAALESDVLLFDLPP